MRGARRLLPSCLGCSWDFAPKDDDVLALHRGAEAVAGGHPLSVAWDPPLQCLDVEQPVGGCERGEYPLQRDLLASASARADGPCAQRVGLERGGQDAQGAVEIARVRKYPVPPVGLLRSEEHTSELQS